MNVPSGVSLFLTASAGRDIYVILDPVPPETAGQTAAALDIQDPEFNKSLEDNGDGTYTLSLSVTGHGINAATNPKANVIFVVDTSSSMDKSHKITVFRRRYALFPDQIFQCLKQCLRLHGFRQVGI